MAKRTCSFPGCSKPHDSLGYCSGHAHKVRRYGDPAVSRKMTAPSLAARLMARSVPQADGCILWTGATTKKGYGSLRFEGRGLIAHRAAFELYTGQPAPDRLMVCHTCDVPNCIAWYHHFLGTAADNNRDRDRKGRRIALSGEAHPAARLTAEAVRSIRADHAAGVLRRVLAERYGVRLATIDDVVQRRSWKHVA